MLYSLKTRILQNFRTFLCQRYLKFSRSQANFNTFDFHRAIHFLVSLIRITEISRIWRICRAKVGNLFLARIKLFADRIDNFMASGSIIGFARFLGASCGGIGRTDFFNFQSYLYLPCELFIYLKREREKKFKRNIKFFSNIISFNCCIARARRSICMTIEETAR